MERPRKAFGRFQVPMPQALRGACARRLWGTAGQISQNSAEDEAVLQINTATGQEGTALQEFARQTRVELQLAQAWWSLLMSKPTVLLQSHMGFFVLHEPQIVRALPQKGYGGPGVWMSFACVDDGDHFRYKPQRYPGPEAVRRHEALSLHPGRHMKLL